MAGSDWDDDSDTGAAPSKVPVAVVAPKKSKFADEDASDSDVKDDWDASDEEEKPVTKAPTGPAPSVRQKGITKQKIAEREAAEQAKLAELQASKDDDPQARKAREHAAILRSDLDNAAALFGATSVSGDNPLARVCRTKEDFEELSTSISGTLISAHGDHPLYALFVESFVKALCAPLKDVEVRKAASGLTTLANLKQQAQKDSQGGKKKKSAQKPGLGLGKNVAPAADTRAYAESLDDDYDDFM